MNGPRLRAFRAVLPDVQSSAAFAEVEAFYHALFAPAGERPYTAQDLRWSPGRGKFLATCSRFPGTLAQGPTTDVGEIDAMSGEIRLVGAGARLARPSPAGETLAFVNDSGVTLLDGEGKATTYTVAGRIEQMEWSRDGARLALLVAGTGADISGAEGGFALDAAEGDRDWGLPVIDIGDEDDRWRTIWILDPRRKSLNQVTVAPLNIWEFCWRDDVTLVVVASDSHSEGSWYHATLRQIDLRTGDAAPLYQPCDQIGQPRVSPDGTCISFIEAICSDRGIVCGALRLRRDGAVRTVRTLDADVSDHHWGSRGQLVFAGLRGTQTVIGLLDPRLDMAEELWASDALTCGDWHPSIAIDGADTPFAIFEAYARAPFMGAVQRSDVTVIADFAQNGAAESIPGMIEAVSWRAGDDMEIQGWLIRDPMVQHGPAPLLLDIHGGPVWAHRNRWVARLRAAGPLVARGWSILLPNPRGAPGRGRGFASGVVGDMGGADARDLLSGVDHFVTAGIADPDRVAVTGTSYGGFMSAMLVTLTDRLAAAVPISPIANWYSQHFTSHIPAFDAAFLADPPGMAGGQYLERSPVFRAAGAVTPTLTMAGGLDRNTPSGQALEFHTALLEAGCSSALCIYPKAGHSLRGYPEYLDSAARQILWLEDHCRGARAAAA